MLYKLTLQNFYSKNQRENLYRIELTKPKFVSCSYILLQPLDWNKSPNSICNEFKMKIT